MKVLSALAIGALLGATIQANSALAYDVGAPLHHHHRLIGGFNAQKNCWHSSFTICQGCEIPVTLRVRTGRTCSIVFGSWGGMAGQQVVVPPGHGVYGSADQTSAAYRPNTGYVGSDYFETRLYFRNQAGKRTFSLVKVNVEVGPNPF